MMTMDSGNRNGKGKMLNGMQGIIDGKLGW